MTSIDESVIARLVRSNQHFEILVDCDKAMQFKKGEASIDDALVVDDVFKNARTGDKQAEENISQAFGTTDLKKVAETIIRKGEIQLTTEYRKKIAEDKKNKLINFISRNAMDPRTNSPIPPKRIELAMQETKTSVDPFKNVEEQVDGIVDKLRPVLPISFEKKTYTITVPPAHASRLYSTIMRYGNPSEQKWLSDGSFHCKMQLPAGLSHEFINELNKQAGGDITIKEE